MIYNNEKLVKMLLFCMVVFFKPILMCMIPNTLVHLKDRNTPLINIKYKNSIPFLSFTLIWCTQLHTLVDWKDRNASLMNMKISKIVFCSTFFLKFYATLHPITWHNGALKIYKHNISVYKKIKNSFSPYKFLILPYSNALNSMTCNCIERK